MPGTWPLIGREQELRAILDRLADGAEGGGVVIAGRAGVGKSRLAREVVATLAAHGWAVRWVAGTATAQAIPLGAFAQWTEGLDDQPLQLVRRVICALTAGAPRVVVAVDDAHLLDDLSAFVLQQLVAHAAARVVVTIRDGEPLSDEVLSLRRGGRLHEVDLQPLSPSANETLLGAMLGGRPSPDSRDRIWHYTRGNPLFLRQLIAQETDGGRLTDRAGLWMWTGEPTASVSLLELVHRQMGEIAENIGHVLDLVTVAEPLERSCLDALADSTAVSDAERRGLIVFSETAQGGRASLGHPLYGDARVAQAGTLRLRRLRGEVVTALRALGDDHIHDPVRLGVLWLDSNLDPDPGVLLHAANVSLIRMDFALAERLSSAATRAGAGIESDLLRAHALGLLERGEEGEQLLRSLSSRDLSPADHFVVVSLRAANLLWPLARPNESWDVIDSGLATCTPDDDPGFRAFRALQLAKRARPAESLSLLNTVRTDRVSDFAGHLAAWARVLASGDTGRLREACRAGDEGHTALERTGQANHQIAVLAKFQVVALVLAGCVLQAQTVANRASDLSRDAPGRPRSMALGAQGITSLARGDLREALSTLRRATDDLEAQEEKSGLRFRFTIVYIQLLARIGDVDAAQRALAHLETIRHPTFIYVESDRMLSAAWVAAARGRTTEARNGALRAAQFACAHGQFAREVQCLQSLVQFGDTRARSRLNELIGVVEGPRAVAAAHYANALAVADGVALDHVCTEFEAMGDRLAAADASAHAATAHRRKGKRGAALTALDRAQQIMRECGAAPSLAIREATASTPLTAREREVVTLVAEGLANRDIARTLKMSQRTVEGHIYRASRRTGVDNRSDLAALIDRTDTRAHQEKG